MQLNVFLSVKRIFAPINTIKKKFDGNTTVEIGQLGTARISMSAFLMYARGMT